MKLSPFLKALNKILKENIFGCLGGMQKYVKKRIFIICETVHSRKSKQDTMSLD